MSKLWTTTALLVAPAAFAAGPNNTADVQTNVTQQQQIEDGLKSGQLSTGEAAKLERTESRIDKTEANTDKNGAISPTEQAKVQKQEAHEQVQLNKLENNGVTGNANSASSERMQGDVQRNINQQTRVEQGAEKGTLTNKEVGKLERGQARTDRTEARAGADGHVGKLEQARVERKENRQSRHVFNKKHNAMNGVSAR